MPYKFYLKPTAEGESIEKWFVRDFDNVQRGIKVQARDMIEPSPHADTDYVVIPESRILLMECYRKGGE